MSHDTNTEIAWAFFDRLANQRVDEALALLAPDARYRMMRSEPHDLDAAQIVHLMLSFFARLPAGMTFTLVSSLADGDRVVLEMEGHADLPDGNVYANRYVQIVTVRDGLVHEVREYLDTKHLDSVIPADFAERWPERP